LVLSATDQTAGITFTGIPRERFSDVVGLERAKRRLGQVMRWLKDSTALAPFGIAPPRGFLLAGRPGTGKTLLAKALAGEADLPFLALSAGELQSKWAGETEERIRDLFRRAREYAPTIVFIDEIDGIGARRSADGNDTTWRQAALDQLLASMDGVVSASRPIFVLGATNNVTILDPALLRPGRFDEVIPIDLPNAAARRAFFELHLATAPREGSIGFDHLVRLTVGCTPAELDRVVREASYSAAAGGRGVIKEADLVTAARLVRFGAADEAIEVNAEERRITAYHEAGHAIAQLRLFPAEGVEFLTIVASEGGALGFLAANPDEATHTRSRGDIERNLAVLLAGRESEALVAASTTDVSTGAMSDIRKATDLAWQAVSEWGLDDDIGTVSLGEIPAVVRGDLNSRAAARVEEWLRAARARARELLEGDRKALDTLAGELLKRESLEGDEMRALGI
jgi:cell division protease FtsH